MSGGGRWLAGLRRLRTSVLLGCGLCALGWTLAAARLPEWQVDRPVSAERSLATYRQLAGRAGLALVPGTPQVVLFISQQETGAAHRLLGTGAPAWLAAERNAVRVAVSHPVAAPLLGSGAAAYFETELALDGRPFKIRLGRLGVQPMTALDSRIAGLAVLLLARGERLGPAMPGDNGQSLFAVLGPGRTAEAAHLLVERQSNLLEIARRPGPGRLEPGRPMAVVYALGLGSVALALLVIALVVVLVIRRRIGFANAAALALLGLLTTNPLPAPGAPAVWAVLLTAFTWLVPAVLLFCLWAAGESLLRARRPGAAEDLDALRAGRLHPAAGRALLAGFAAGAAVVGYRLALLALAVPLPGLAAAGGSLRLPNFGPNEIGFLVRAQTPAAVALLAYALLLRRLPHRAALALAALGAAAIYQPVPLAPYPAAVLLGAPALVLLLSAGLRYGLSALLAGATVAATLPVVLFGVQHFGWIPDWQPGGLAFAAGVTAAIPILGLLALARPAAGPARPRPPAFLRRLEEERRAQAELELLARLQLDLLPRLPAVPGWQLAARSLVATEAGGDLYDAFVDDSGALWVAAGDVAGHGYSCAIAQAMTRAALASLAGPDRTPAEVLGEVHRVLREDGPERLFTTCVLLRFDPATGRGLLANAGHPFPLLAADGEVSEIAVPGLPLGQGPPRTYRDHPIEVPPGGLLVLASDGLFEGPAEAGATFGAAEAGAVLRRAARRDAEAVLKALLAAWKEACGPGRPPDDTTLVVLRREW